MLSLQALAGQHPDGPAQWRPLVLLIGACVLLSFARAGLASTLRVDESGLSALTQGLFSAVFAVLGGAVFWAYVRTIQISPGSSEAHAEAQSGPSPRHMLAVAIVLQILAAMALPLTSNDLFSNLAYGALSAHGHNPYLVGPGALPPTSPFVAMVGARWLNTPIAYGPVLAWLNHLAVTDSVLSSVISFKLLMLAVSIAIVLTAYGYCRSCLEGARARQAFLLIAWNPLLAWEIAGQAHNDGVMVLALMGFVWAASRQREVAAVALLVVAVSAKYAAGAVLGLYLVLIFRRAPLRALALGLLAAGLSALLMLPFWTGSSSLQGPATALGGDPKRVAGSFAGVAVFFASFIGPVAAQRIYLVCLLGGACLLLLIYAYALLRTRTLDDVFHYSLITMLIYCLAAAPWFQPWYATWVLPLAVAHPAIRWRNLAATFSALMLVEYAGSASLWALVLNPVFLRRMQKLRGSASS